MSGLDSNRIALVTAAPGGRGAAASYESVGTGYFLTGDLVLTAGHIADRPDWTFSVRAEIDRSGEGRWSDAKPVWIGDVDVDAMLLRTDRPFGNWEPPSFLTDKNRGTWRSAGYAEAAVGGDDRKTFPLNGSFEASVGQGPPMLYLTTNQIISPKWDTYWKGSSGAPVFSTESGGDGGLAGIITDANDTQSNGLIALPAKRLLEDIHFRSTITPSFLGQLPETDFCLVLSSEGSNSSLLKLTANVLKGFRKKEREFQGLHEAPIPLKALEAVRSPENWAAAVDALARAKYLIADVTSFQPVVMLLLGVRSVLRRGVTISVTEEQVSDASSPLPFNVQETRLLRSGSAHFYDDLHLAMAEGSANQGADSNYLDLPAYQAVRTPRPASWADNDEESLLVLCPFNEDYSDFYSEKLRDIIRANTGDKKLLRMIDLKSPRLVGQALYEQVRWSTFCVVDWTGWRPNVFFELGVRLACSERDPMCIIQRSDVEVKPTGFSQYDLLLQLLNPVVYDRDDPGETLESALDSWPSPPPSSRPTPALPPAATFRVAQASFQWQPDPMLIPPYLELLRVAQLISGSDWEKTPVPFVLFSYNEQFDAKLRAAALEKWIAAWLHLWHISNADEASFRDNEPELLRIASLVEYALRSSDVARHVRLRKEIGEFRRSMRSRTTGESSRTNG